MPSLLRDLALLSAVTAAGGWVLVRATIPRDPAFIGSREPIVESTTGVEAATKDCVRRPSPLPPTTRVRFEFQVDHPARFLGARGRPRLSAAVLPTRGALVQLWSIRRAGSTTLRSGCYALTAIPRE
jgi:hypothetical protein